MSVRIFSVTFLLVALSGAACSSTYTLPDPPPAGARRNASLVRADEVDEGERNYLAARAALLELNSLLEQRRFEEALERMSQETQAMLAYVAPDPNESSAALDALSGGTIQIRGARRPFDARRELLADDLSKLVDDLEGEGQAETPRRKEIFAVGDDGSARRIVMIREGGAWVLHRTSLEAPGS